MRRKIVAGNWKMNLTLEQAEDLTIELNSALKKQTAVAEVLVAPPFPYLGVVEEILFEDELVHVAAQNCAAYEKGAYTGEVSAAMLQSLCIDYVIIGHSERRQHFNEEADVLRSKTRLALQNNLTPIFCCGEPQRIRDAGVHERYVLEQLQQSLFDLAPEDFSRIVIAYEPVWAIGTGQNATAEQAQQMHAFIRQQIAQQYGSEIAAKISLLYGGSCNAKNAAELFACPDVDGGLIGGASLKADEFLQIIHCIQ